MNRFKYRRLIRKAKTVEQKRDLIMRFLDNDEMIRFIDLWIHSHHNGRYRSLLDEYSADWQRVNTLAADARIRALTNMVEDRDRTISAMIRQQER